MHLYLQIAHSLFFTYPEDSPHDDPSHDTEQDNPLPDAPPTRQGTTPIPVTADEVLRSTGEVRRKWIGAGKTELDNLTDTPSLGFLLNKGMRSKEWPDPRARST